jgi:beta-lactamase regulating signal transducer with metallopeptidase domain
LSNGDIDNIIAYTSEPKAEAQAPAVGQTGVAVQMMMLQIYILGALVLVMAILVVMLFLVNNVLKSCKANGIEVAPQEARTSIWQAFKKSIF